MKQQNPTGIPLSDLLQKVKLMLDQQLPDSCWLSAEISELKDNVSGHCYLTLIEKEEDGEQLKAKVNANIWASAYRLIKPYFEDTTGRPLSAGMKVLVKANVQYHILYGLSLNITDIEPAYTMGDVAIQRRNTIARLESDGVFDMNRELDFPILPQRIAVISSEQAAGYQDFIHQLHENNYGYDFHITLFSSAVQGAVAAEEMIAALDAVNSCREVFDVVVIIRGGGAVADLACFDDYALASNVAQFPLPILAGIGHNKDESVVDMVSHLSLKTPTAVADYLIGCLVEEEGELDNYNAILAGIAATVLNRETQDLQQLQQQIHLYAQQQLQQEHFNLQLYDNDLQSYNPYNILARGYAVIRQQGRAVTDSAHIRPNEAIDITLHKGQLRITNYELHSNEEK